MRGWIAAGVTVAAAFLCVAAAQGAEPTVASAQDEEAGTYLTDGQGNALYLFLPDDQGPSQCTDACAEAWPPLVVTGDPTAGTGVAGSLLGTVERADGSLQVTYSGWPLYTFAKDAQPGDTTGQGVGGNWFLVSPYGEAIEPKTPPATQADQPAQPPAGVEPMLASALMNEGRDIFANNCAVCHGDKGQGGEGIPLHDYTRLADQTVVLKQILRGGHYMPPFGGILDDRQVAAAATFIRNSFGNDYGAVAPEEVSQFR